MLDRVISYTFVPQGEAFFRSVVTIINCQTDAAPNR